MKHLDGQYSLPTQILNQTPLHLHSHMQLLDRDPLADGVGLRDVAVVSYQRVHVPLIAPGLSALRHGDCAFVAGHAVE